MPLESASLSEMTNWYEEGIFLPEEASLEGVGAVDVPGAGAVVLLVATTYIVMVAPTRSIMALVMATVL